MLRRAISTYLRGKRCGQMRGAASNVLGEARAHARTSSAQNQRSRAARSDSLPVAFSLPSAMDAGLQPAVPGARRSVCGKQRGICMASAWPCCEGKGIGSVLARRLIQPGSSVILRHVPCILMSSFAQDKPAGGSALHGKRRTWEVVVMTADLHGLRDTRRPWEDERAQISRLLRRSDFAC